MYVCVCVYKRKRRDEEEEKKKKEMKMITLKWTEILYESFSLFIIRTASSFNSLLLYYVF